VLGAAALALKASGAALTPEVIAALQRSANLQAQDSSTA
jgi:hypothetical protein